MVAAVLFYEQDVEGNLDFVEFQRNINKPLMYNILTLYRHYNTIKLLSDRKYEYLTKSYF
jgi:hypothetical protein